MTLRRPEDALLFVSLMKETSVITLSNDTRTLWRNDTVDDCCWCCCNAVHRAATCRRRTVAVRAAAAAAGNGRERTRVAANRRHTNTADCRNASRTRCASPRWTPLTVKATSSTTPPGTTLRPPRSHCTLHHGPFFRSSPNPMHSDASCPTSCQREVDVCCP